MGIVMLYFRQHPWANGIPPKFSQFGVPYLSISVSLNILLTLMIVVRLALHGRNIRAATGSAAGISGLYNAVSTMLIESCALFTVSSLVVVAALVRTKSNRPAVFYPGMSVVDIFFPILAETQVRVLLRPQSPGQVFNVMVDWTGDRLTAYCSTGCRPERVGEPHLHHWTRQFDRY